MFIQEVFFHLGGAIEVFAQLVNDRRGLGHSTEAVSIRRLATEWLREGDPLLTEVNGLYKNPRGESLPEDPYTDDCLMWRIWNYRHQVTHRRRNPIQASLVLNPAFKVTSDEPLGARFESLMKRGDPPTQRSGHFLLDPRDPQTLAASKETVENELHAMCDRVEARLRSAIQVLS